LSRFRRRRKSGGSRKGCTVEWGYQLSAISRYGRITTSEVPWVMRFPTDPIAMQLLGIDRVYGIRERELAILQVRASSAARAHRRWWFGGGYPGPTFTSIATRKRRIGELIADS
jgi:hypothetical protein